MVAQAVGAILSGAGDDRRRLPLAERALRPRDSAPARRRPRQARVGGQQTWDEFFLPWGLVTPGQFFALIAQRHMTELGTTHEQLGRIAIACRERANANPAAQMHDRVMTMDEYLESPMIAEPLRLFDFCLETDGADALVVTTAERARDLRQPPALDPGRRPGRQPGRAGRHDVAGAGARQRLHMAVAPAAPSGCTRAGLGPDDVDVAQFYDCFTITALLQFEDYGFCGTGEGGPFAESGRDRPRRQRCRSTRPAGTCPRATSTA